MRKYAVISTVFPIFAHINNKVQYSPPGGRWPSVARSEEERRNLKVWKMSEIRKISEHFCPHSSSVTACGGDSFSPGEAIGAPAPDGSSTV